ncbi:MAG: tRNA preQ1(34) S-adenosylmethionine ribosyltransferase-isomerase QueA [Dehalococcoidia bacterium]|nr:tRNA preQ1(34) S-adenosylmethionine ribosyltransferase-isomerase QueA [Dehalococcoidia bacterium]
MRTSDFDYSLPPEFIAQTPAEPRDQSRLMVVRRSDSSIEHHRFSDIIEFLQPGDVLVLNDTRVIPARLKGQKGTGGKVEILLLRRLEPGLWEALVKPSKRIAVGDKVELESTQPGSKGKTALVEVLERKEEGVRIVRFADEAVVDDLGQIPLPPYIHDYRGERERYQTVYSREKGSVAAPTAGLHFTPGLLDQIKGMGIDLVFVTLHVGLDTFRPIRKEDPRQHHIHHEYGVLSENAAARLTKARHDCRRIVCVGTTAVRLLEQAALASESSEGVQPFRGWVDLFILPGHRFRLVDVMVTNFHLPRSTLLMMVSAFSGNELIKRAYQEAIRERYRFYSFGDAMLILP